MPTRLSYNVNTTSKANFGQTAHVSANTTSVLDTVVTVINKIETDIVNDLTVPTSAQLKSISAVLSKLELTNGVDPAVLSLLKTCVNLVAKYASVSETLSTTLSQLESAQFKASLVDDANKLKAYLLKRGVAVFPPQTITVTKVQVAEAVAIHIKEYGLPIQMTKLAMIEQNLQNRQLTLDGTILSMIQQFIDTLKY